MKTIYSIGANGATPTTLLYSLAQNGVTHLLDIRANPNIAFAKCRRENLPGFLEAGKIKYEWLKELAPSRALAREMKTAEGMPDFKKYLAEIGDDGIDAAWNKVKELPVPCLMGSEPLLMIDKCHRKALIGAIVAKANDGWRVVHLDGINIAASMGNCFNLFKGKVYNIVELFRGVNKEYFNSRYNEDDIVFAWEPLPRGGPLGYYRYPDLIVLNSILDNALMPQPVVEAVLYHEMLHLQRAHDGLPAGHITEFYADEAMFKEFSKIFKFDFSSAFQLILGGRGK